MSHLRALGRRALTIAGVVAAVNACSEQGRVVAPKQPTGGALFKSYVSIGNSIAAGVQSNGINDSTQRQSFAYLLAQQMGTRFVVPFFPRPGCTPPIANWQTGALVNTGLPSGQTSNSSTCTLRDVASAGLVLNNVAVPSAASTEVDALTSPYHNTLTTLILGGKTQVAKALDADPTFATIEIGPNDVLQAGYTGLLAKTTIPGPGGTTIELSRGLTPQATFTANYDKMISDLTAGAPHLQGGVLLGNVKTSSAPILFPAAAFSNPAFLAGFSTAATGSAAGLTLNPNCVGSTSLISFAILPAIRSGAHPRTIACAKGSDATNPLVGDWFVLDAAEQTTLNNAVDAMNTYIQGKANAINFAYVDINPILLAQKAPGGCINAVPNLAAAATTSPFGSCVSFDGLHPSLAGQKLIANLIITAINTKYSTTLALVP